MPIHLLASPRVLLPLPPLSLLLLQVSLDTHDIVCTCGRSLLTLAHHMKCTSEYLGIPIACSLLGSLMCTWCLFIDAPLVLVGAGAVAPSARVDSSGSQLCELCPKPKRLSRCKGKPHNYGSGKICNKCYLQLLRGVSAGAASSSSCRSSSVSPPPKKKRRTASDPGNHSDSDTAIITETTGTASTQARALRSSLPPSPASSGSPTQTLHEWDVSAMLLLLSS